MRFVHKSAFAAIVVMAACLLAAPAARAGFIGSSVSLTYYLPDTATVFQGPNVAMVSAGVEYPNYFPVAGSIDISDTTIKISSASGTQYSPAAFNGEVFTFTGADVITGVTADASSTFSPVNISFTANTITLNYAGVADPGGTFSLLDVTFAAAGPGPGVPLPPAVWGGLLAGLAAIAAAARMKLRAV
jgi:hypothetical protein